MKKQTRRVKDVLYGMVLGLLITAMAVPALAAGVKTIEANYMDIKLVVDGVPVTPKDASGKEVEPFVYEGTTYLPVRAVGEALGKDVKWDGETKTVYIGEIPGKINYLVDVCPPYETSYYKEYHSAKAEFFKMGGKDYSNGFTLETVMDSGALINLNGEYSTLTFEVGHVDKSEMLDANMKIYLDGEFSQEIEVKAEGTVQKISIPLEHALQLKVEFDTVKHIWNSSCWGVANAILE